MLNTIARVLGGDPNKKELQRLAAHIQQVNRLETEYESLSEEGLRNKTVEFRQRLANGATLDDLMIETFAAVREASKRTTGMRHFDVQLIGGAVLHSGKIAEMRTGEGKTLVATLPLYLNALTGRGVHLVTVNDYLARRDARWMAPIYATLGMTVGVLQMASRTDNGTKAFVVDLSKRSPHEDQNQLRLVERREAYLTDITYGTNSEYGFDYLRDNLTMRLDDRVQHGHYYAIVDEVDNILIDEARTPLIISGPASEDVEWYARTAQVVRGLRPEDYEVEEKDRAVSLTEIGEAHVEELLNMSLRDPERPEDITPEQARILGYLEQALRAQFLYRRNKDYLVQAGKVVIVDEFTGRLMPGRRWSEGLHQAVEAKEGVKVEPENVTYATITLQNYFRMYEKLAGMTGTALTEGEEFHKIYKLDVLPIPTNLEYIATRETSELMEVEAKDEGGYKYVYYSGRADTERKPVFWKRKDYPDQVYRSEEGKIRAITLEIIRYHVMGRPQLVGTTSVEHSERLSDRLQAEPVRKILLATLIRQAYLDQNRLDFLDKNIPELQPLNKPLDDLDIGTMRPLARNLGISANVEDPPNLERLMSLLRIDVEDQPRLVRVMQAGVPHQVLNARKHDEESMIIARAGAFGAVTIATNMAGRGVDIKLGGELPDEITLDVVRVLGKTGSEDPYEMTNDERRQALLKLQPEDYGIYETPVKAFFQYLDESRRVRELGGLHVIGSERHEARRIDNQLRGRSARQGDPGSSRFYLSLEDELMRLFGGQQVEGLWKRIMVDESQPIEMNILGRLVEQSQERVEGANFDVRKHLLEYDDVLNSQRKRIYEQRDRVFTKEDLTEDVLDMLGADFQERVPSALKDEEGPWKLLAYLDEVQPPVGYEELTYPAFSLRLLMDEIKNSLPKTGADTDQLLDSIIGLAERALEAEKDHVMHAADTLLARTEESLENQQQERYDSLDLFLEGLRDADEESPSRRPQELLSELTGLVRAPLRLNNEQQRRLMEGGDDLKEIIRQQIDDFLVGVNLSRVVGALERRLEESLTLRPSMIQGKGWKEVAGVLLGAVENIYAQRQDRLLGEEGQIASDLETALERVASNALDDRLLSDLLLVSAHGTRVTFDTKTHRKGAQRYWRLRYVYLTARLTADSDVKELTERIITHLEEALGILQAARGRMAWNRLSQTETNLEKLSESLRDQIAETLGKEKFEELATRQFETFSAEEHSLVEQVLGWRLQVEAYRELLLHSISDQWIDYLTKVEALRVSIGLEAYAQRDPLVQYKGQASEMFKQLLADIRAGVIHRLFTYQSRGMVGLMPVEKEAGNVAPQVGQSPVQTNRPQQLQPGQGGGGKKKRKRH